MTAVYIALFVAVALGWLWEEAINAPLVDEDERIIDPPMTERGREAHDYACRWPRGPVVAKVVRV